VAVVAVVCATQGTAERAAQAAAATVVALEVRVQMQLLEPQIEVAAAAEEDGPILLSLETGQMAVLGLWLFLILQLLPICLQLAVA
jgi:hypothetical protein